MHNLRGKYILSLNKPRTTSYGLSSFSYVSAKLRNAPVPDFIRTTEFTSFKRENTGRHFLHRLLFLISISLNYVFIHGSVYAMYFSCNLVSRRC